MKERRKTSDRRNNDLEQELLLTCNRRIQPDRRLNNISAEWISMTETSHQPVARLVFSKR
jgi:hypothetical protein